MIKQLMSKTTRTIAPNDFIVSLSTFDMEKLEQWGVQTMVDEIVESATNHAMGQRYSFVGGKCTFFS